MEARSELKYVAPRSWCKATSQATAVTIVNHNGENKKQCKLEVGLCNIGATFCRASFILPTLAPKDRLANYDVEADPILDEFLVTHRPRLFLDSWGLNPKVYGLPRPSRQAPPALLLPALLETVDAKPVTDIEGDTVRLPASKSDHDMTCAPGKPVMNKPVAENSGEIKPVLVTPIMEKPVADKAVAEGPSPNELVTDNISEIEYDKLVPSQAESKSDENMTINTMLARSYDQPCLTSSPEGKDSVSSSPNATSPVPSTPENTGRASGDSTAPTSAASTPEKGKAEKKVVKETEKNLEPPSNINPQPLENRENPAQATTLGDHGSSLLTNPIRLTQAEQEAEVSTDSASSSLVSKVDVVPVTSRYSMIGSALSFAQEQFSYSMDSIPQKLPSTKPSVRTSPAKPPAPRSAIESSGSTISTPSPTNLSTSGPSTHAATRGKGSKKGNKKKQKKASKKAKQASKENYSGSNGALQHQYQPKPPPTAIVVNVSSIFPKEHKAVSDKSQSVAASSSTSSSPKLKGKISLSCTSAFPTSAGDSSMSNESPTALSKSTHSFLAPLPAEEKSAKKGKAKKKNVNRKAKRAIMIAAKDKIESQHLDEQVRSAEGPVHGLLTPVLSAVDTSSALNSKDSEIQEEIGKEEMTEDHEQKFDILKSTISETTQGDIHRCDVLDTSTTNGEGKDREKFAESQAIDALTVVLDNPVPVVVQEVQDSVDRTTCKERRHDGDTTACGSSTIEMSSERGHSNVLTADNEHFNLGGTTKSSTSAGSAALALDTKGPRPLKVIQAQRLFIPRCLLVPRGSSRPIWKTRALVMHSKGQKGAGHGKSKEIDTLEIKRAKESNKEAAQFTTTYDLSTSDISNTDSLSTKDNRYPKIRVQLVSYNPDRLLTDKPWTLREHVRNLETFTGSSTCHELPGASEEATPEPPTKGGQTSVSAPREAYNPHSFLSPGVTSLIIKKLNAIASRNSSASELKDKVSDVPTSQSLIGGFHSPRSSTLQLHIDKSKLKAKMAELSLQEKVNQFKPEERTAGQSSHEDTNQQQLDSRDEEVCASTPQGVYNSQCLLLPGETSWTTEKMNMTAFGGFDESELKEQTVEPALNEDDDQNQPSSLDAATVAEDLHVSELKGQIMESAVAEDSEPNQPASPDATPGEYPNAFDALPSATIPDIIDHDIPTSHNMQETTTTTPQPSTATPSPATSPKTVATLDALAEPPQKPEITSALESIDIAKAAIAVQQAPENKSLLLQLILVLVVRLVCLCFS